MFILHSLAILALFDLRNGMVNFAGLVLRAISEVLLLKFICKITATYRYKGTFCAVILAVVRMDSLCVLDPFCPRAGFIWVNVSCVFVHLTWKNFFFFYCDMVAIHKSINFLDIFYEMFKRFLSYLYFYSMPQTLVLICPVNMIPDMFTTLF